MSALNLDKKYKSVLDTIRMYPDQVKQAWDEINSMDFPHDFQHIDKVAVCGMGGSALGARIVDSFLINRIRIPIEIFNQYHIPNYSDDKTLIISYSYSGNTEEAVSALNEAILKETKIFVITNGGKLEDIKNKYKLPSYVIDPEYNPSGQPRNAIGYSVGSILGLFSKLNFAHISQDELESSLFNMKNVFRDNDESVDVKENLARSVATKLKDKAVVIVASEHLVGVAHTIKNQFNESAKTFSALFTLPELNHHLMEGLVNPKDLKLNTHFLFLNSNLYSDRVKKRYPLTADVVEKNGYQFTTYSPRSDTKLSQVMELLTFGSLVVYYLSKTYGIDPNKIPWVDHFKKQLSEK